MVYFMAEHIYEKEALINRLESYLGKTFEMIDNKGMFEHVQDINLQKGIAGAVVEQCIFEYPHDSRQEADLIIVEGDKYIKTELKTTGLLIQKHLKNTILQRNLCLLLRWEYMILQNKNLKHPIFGRNWNICLLYITIILRNMQFQLMTTKIFRWLVMSSTNFQMRI